MAIKSDTLPVVSPMELAREAAQQESSASIHPASEPKEEKHAPKTKSTITVDIDDIIVNKEARFTRTFTLSAETDKQLNAAAARLNMAKSAIIEKAFTAWWDAVQKMTNK